MKRFTDSEKWSDKFFRTLTPTGKIFWIWLCDNCDNAGIWERDDDLFKIFSGTSVEVDAHLEELGNRVEILEDDKILLPKFVQFQQGGMLQEAKAPHRQILRILEKHGLEQRDCGEIRKVNGTLTEGLAKGKVTLTEGKGNPSVTLTKGLAKVTGNSNSKGKGKGKGEESEKGEIRPEGWNDQDMEDFRPAWEAYLQHRKENNWKKPGATQMKTLFAKFAKVGKSVSIQSLEDAVASGWKGVFPEKETTTKEKAERDYDNPLR